MDYTAIPSGQGATLSVMEAQSFTKDWIDSRFASDERYHQNQMRWLMRQLADLALAETIKKGGNVHDYEKRLAVACDLLYDCWGIVTSDELKGWTLSKEPPTEEQLEKRAAAKRVLWRRRDPLRGYREGFESPYQTDFRKDEFIDYVAGYLSHAWLRHPVLDWIFVDALVTRELSMYGEEVKRQILPGRRDLTGAFHHRYFSSKGNLAEMMKPDWEGRFKQLAWNLVSVGVPIVLIWAFLGWTTTGIWLIAAYVVVEVGRRRLARSESPDAKAQMLWGAMYQVWRVLEGPIVNPTLVRAELVKTTEQGAGWDNAVWSIIDRVIEHDRSVWVVAPVDG